MTPPGRPFTLDEALALHQHAPGLRLRMVPNTSPAEWLPADPPTAGQMAAIHRVPSLRSWGVLRVAGPVEGEK